MGERLVLAMVLVRTTVVPTGTVPKSTTGWSGDQPAVRLRDRGAGVKGPTAQHGHQEEKNRYQFAAGAEILHGRPL